MLLFFLDVLIVVLYVYIRGDSGNKKHQKETYGFLKAPNSMFFFEVSFFVEMNMFHWGDVSNEKNPGCLIV